MTLDDVDSVRGLLDRLKYEKEKELKHVSSVSGLDLVVAQMEFIVYLVAIKNHKYLLYLVQCVCDYRYCNFILEDC